MLVGHRQERWLQAVGARPKRRALPCAVLRELERLVGPAPDPHQLLRRAELAASLQATTGVRRSPAYTTPTPTRLRIRSHLSTREQRVPEPGQQPTNRQVRCIPCAPRATPPPS